MISLHPLTGIGEIGPGDGLEDMLVAALHRTGLSARENDVLVVTSKILSKAEGRFVDLAFVKPGARAEELAAITRKDPRLVELVLSESSDVVRAAPHVLITRHRLGYVMANAGIDQSNLGTGRRDQVLLLPADPDATAARLQRELTARLGVKLAILISDSFGRPWRQGVVNVAVGAAGLPAIVDHRGETDRDGRTLEMTQVALADAIASAAGLASGEGAEGIPAVLVRGLSWSAAPSPAAALIRPREQDLFA